MDSADTLAQPFDYIVVGGGTAGLVVANRLSEDSNARVLVIEAGADHSADPLVATPGLVAGLYGKEEYDWNFCSPPQVSDCRAASASARQEERCGREKPANRN